MDPQQRFLLEIAYESFENSGLTLEQLSGSNTGVYVASFNCDYERMLSRDPENSPSYRGTGTGSVMFSDPSFPFPSNFGGWRPFQPTKTCLPTLEPS